MRSKLILTLAFLGAAAALPAENRTWKVRFGTRAIAIKGAMIGGLIVSDGLSARRRHSVITYVQLIAEVV